MDGKLFKLTTIRYFLIGIFLAVILYPIFLPFVHKNTNSLIRFEVVEQDQSSKFSLVDLSKDNKKILATFSIFNSSFGRILHRNDFWSPVSCSAMPNLFLENNFLTVLDIKKNAEKGGLSVNFFIYDYKNNILSKSENIDYLVGDIYTIDKKNVTYFTYKDQKLNMNSFNPDTHSVKSEYVDTIFEKDPSFRFYEIDKKIYVKIFSENSTTNYYFDGDSLSKVKVIPDRIFWSVLNEKDTVSLSKNKVSMVLPKSESESYKTLKASDSYIVFSRMSLYNISNFTIEILDIDSKKITPIYSNNGIENNYYLISVD